MHSPFTLNTYVISSTAVSAAKVMLNWGVKVMRSFWNACLFVLFLVCFPFLCIFLVVSLRRVQVQQWAWSVTSHAWKLLRHSLLAELCWNSSWLIFLLFQSTWKQLIRVNLQPVVCSAWWIAKSTLRAKSSPLTLVRSLHAEPRFNTQSYWMTYKLIRAMSFTS